MARPLIAALLATLAAGCCRNAAAHGAAAGAEPAAAPSPPPRVVPGEYILTVAPGTTVSSLQSSLADLTPKRIQPLDRDKVLVSFAEDPGLSRLSFRIGNGQILAVQPNYAYKAQPR